MFVPGYSEVNRCLALDTSVISTFGGGALRFGLRLRTAAREKHRSDNKGNGKAQIRFAFEKIWRQHEIGYD